MNTVIKTPRQDALAVSVKEMADLLPFSKRTLRRMDATGKLPRAHRVGGKKLWILDDLRQWVVLGFPDREKFEELTKNAAK